jgi:hypothetical protein
MQVVGGQRSPGRKVLGAVTLASLGLAAVAGCGGAHKSAQGRATVATAPASSTTSSSSSTSTTSSTTAAPIATTAAPLPLTAATERGMTLRVPSGWSFSDDRGGGSGSTFVWQDPDGPAYTVELDVDACTGCIASGSLTPGTATLTAPSGQLAESNTVISPDRSYGGKVTVRLPAIDSSTAGVILESLATTESTPAPTTSTTSARQVVLGQAGAGPYVEGFGAVEPSTVSAGGDGSSDIQSVHWSSWGGAQATGTGTALYVAADQTESEGIMEPATVVAFSLAPSGCDIDEPPTYTAVEWYFPQHGQSFDPSRYLNTCTDLWSGS